MAADGKRETLAPPPLDRAAETDFKPIGDDEQSEGATNALKTPATPPVMSRDGAVKNNDGKDKPDRKG